MVLITQVFTRDAILLNTYIVTVIAGRTIVNRNTADRLQFSIEGFLPMRCNCCVTLKEIVIDLTMRHRLVSSPLPIHSPVIITDIICRILFNAVIPEYMCNGTCAVFVPLVSEL